MDRFRNVYGAQQHRASTTLVRLSLLAVVAFGWVSVSKAEPQATVSEPIAMDRLEQIASKLGRTDENAVPLMTEAVRLCGFSIKDEDGKAIAEPLLDTRFQLAVTDTEIKYYSRLLRSGNRVKLGDFVSGLDVLFKEAGGTGEFYPLVENWLGAQAVSINPSRRCLKQFLWMLSASHDGKADVPFIASSKLDPLQVLLLTRCITEDIGVPLRKHLQSLKGPTLMASLQPTLENGFQLPGWAEDGYVGTITTIFGNVVEGVEKLKNYGKVAEKANAIASIAKFIATYAFLEVSIGVEEPGQPLVRTKDTDAGSRRTVTAKFVINGSVVTDWLKENRKLVALAGLDVDMPKTGALSGVEANFDIDQDRYSSKSHLIQTVGTVDISKIVSDADGIARMKIEGCPQRTKLDPKNLLPVEKQVKISVTPQVKSTEMKQDMVDAVLGAVGLRSGPVGLITPVMECLYRMKWMGTKFIRLKVKDWTEATSYANVTFEIHADGSSRNGKNSDTVHIHQVLNITDMKMDNAMGENDSMPELPKEALAALTPAQRKQIEASMGAMKTMLKSLRFTSGGPGNVSLSINDHTITQGVDEGCTTSKFTTHSSAIGSKTWEHPKEQIPDAAFNLSIEIDKETNKAKISVIAGTPGHFVNQTAVDGKVETSSGDGPLGFGMDVSWESGPIEFQATKAPESDKERTDWYGATRVPIKFGPNNKYSGVMIVSLALTKRVKNPAKAK